MTITYRTNMEDVNWQEMKRTLKADHFDNGRTPEQLRLSFANSYRAVVAYDDEGSIIGTARVLSDGVGNAYVVDVWTLSAYRGQGIATRMMEILMDDLWGQHIYLQTDDAQEFYRKLGFIERPTGMELIKGKYLVNKKVE